MNIGQKFHVITLLIIFSIFYIFNCQKVIAQSSKSGNIFLIANSDSNITLLGTWEHNILNETRDIVVNNGYLFLMNKVNGLYILDVENPSNPILVDSCILSGYCGYLTVDNGFAYIINDGLQIVDIQDPSNPIVLGHWPGSNGDDIAVQGNFAYITAGYHLYIIDVSDKSNPSEKGDYDAGSCDLDKVCVSGDYAYVGSDYLQDQVEREFRIIDVSEPENPTLIGKYEGSWQASSWLPGNNRPVTGLSIRGSYLYGTHQYFGFGIFDVSNPSNPTDVGIYWGKMNDFFIEGDYVYVLDYVDDQCKIINISNPITPQLTGFYSIDGDAITVQDGVAYVAAENLHIFKNDLATNIEKNFEFQPIEYKLEQNYPNPFNPLTTIQFTLKKQGYVQINVYNTIGQKVATITNDFYTAGRHRVNFNGSSLPSGIYIYRIQAGSYMGSQKMILMN